MTEREHAVFDGAGAVETPLGVAEGLGVLALERGFGREVGEEFGAEGVVGVHVFRREDDDATSEAVAERVYGGFLFAFRGARAGGFRFLGGWGGRHANAILLAIE